MFLCNPQVNQVNLKDFDASVLRNYCAGGSQEVAGFFSFINLTVSSLQTTFVQVGQEGIAKIALVGQGFEGHFLYVGQRGVA